MTATPLTAPALGCMFFGTRVSEPDAFALLDQFIADLPK